MLSTVLSEYWHFRCGLIPAAKQLKKKKSTSYQTYFSKAIFLRLTSGCGAALYKVAKSSFTAAELQNISVWPMLSSRECMTSLVTCILPATWTDKKLIIQEEWTGTHLVLSVILGFGWVLCLFTCLSFKWGKILWYCFESEHQSRGSILLNFCTYK